jgi:hypothetical protein
MNDDSSESWGCRGEEGDWTRGFIVHLGRTPLDTRLRVSFKIPRAARSNSAGSVEITAPSAGRLNLATRSHAQARREISQAGSTASTQRPPVVGPILARCLRRLLRIKQDELDLG